jgi:hypothetical protein
MSSQDHQPQVGNMTKIWFYVNGKLGSINRNLNKNVMDREGPLKGK